MMKQILFAALALACLATAAAGPAAAAPTPLYRMIVFTKWNTTSATEAAKLVETEPKNVLPCVANMVRGVMGAGLGADGYTYYAKIYDFTSYDQYNLYKTCSNQAIYPSTDPWVANKTRMGFKITTATPLPEVGKWVVASTGNSTKPADTLSIQNASLSANKCQFTPAYGAFIADAAYNSNLKAPVGNGWYATFPEGAGAVGFFNYLIGSPAWSVPPPASVMSLLKLTIGVQMFAAIKTIKIK